MSTIVLIINIILFVIMGLAILFGLLRNFKSNLSSLIAVVVVSILTFLLSGLLAGVLQKVDINGQTVQTILESAIADSLEQESLNSVVLSEYARSISFTIWHVISFVILLVVGFFSIAPILKLILKSVLPLSNQKTTNIGLKIAGTVMSLVSFLIAITLLTAPIIGLTKVAEEVCQELEEEDHQIKKITDTLREVNNGPFLQFLKIYSGGEFGLQKSVVNKITTIDTKYGKIELVNDFDDFIELFKIVYGFTKEDNDIYNSLINNKDQLFSTLRETDSVSTFMPAIIEILRISNDIDVINFDEIDWDVETNNFITVLDEVLKSLQELDFNLEDPEAILGNDKLPDALQSLGQKISNSKIMTDIVLKTLNNYLMDELINELPESLKEMFELFDLTKMNLSNDLFILGQIGNLIYEIGLDENQNIDYLNKIDEIGSLMELPFKLSSVEDNELVVVEALLEFTGLKGILSENNMELNFEGKNITYEIKHIKAALINLLNICKYNNVDLNNMNLQQLLIDVMNSEDSKNHELIDSFINDMCSSDILVESFISFLSILFEEYGTEWKSETFTAIENDYTLLNKEEFKDSIKTLIKVMNDLSNLESLDLFNLDETQLEKYRNNLTSLNDCSLITMDPLISIIESNIIGLGINVELLEKMYDQNGDGLSKQEWKKEISTIFELFEILNGVSINQDSLTTNSIKIGTALDLMKTSYIFGNDVRCDYNSTVDDNIFNGIIHELFLTFDLVKPDNEYGFITLEQLNSEDWSTYNWENEMSAISHFDINSGNQNTDILAEIQKSEIIKKYYDVASIINEKIENVEFDNGFVNIKLSDYVNDGRPFTNEDLASLNWSYEAKNIDSLVSCFEENSISNLVSKLDNLAQNEPTSIGGKTARKIINSISN